MTNPDDLRNARKILYVLTAEQHLRAGDMVALDLLTHDLERHQMGAQDLQQALRCACDQGWLHSEPNDALQLTEQGFALNFGQ